MSFLDNKFSAALYKRIGDIVEFSVCNIDIIGTEV